MLVRCGTTVKKGARHAIMSHSAPCSSCHDTWYMGVIDMLVMRWCVRVSDMVHAAWCAWWDAISESCPCLLVMPSCLRVSDMLHDARDAVRSESLWHAAWCIMQVMWWDIIPDSPKGNPIRNITRPRRPPFRGGVEACAAAWYSVCDYLLGSRPFSNGIYSHIACRGMSHATWRERERHVTCHMERERERPITHDM
jgi:hypothetical protein